MKILIKSSPKSELLKYKDAVETKYIAFSMATLGQPEPQTLKDTFQGMDTKSFSQLIHKPESSIKSEVGQSFMQNQQGQKPQTIFEVLEDICKKNNLPFGKAFSSIFGNDLCLYHKTDEELLKIINEKKIKLNLK